MLTEAGSSRTAHFAGLKIVIITHERPDLARRAIDSVLGARQQSGLDIPILVANSSKARLLDTLPPGVEELHVPQHRRAVDKRDLAWRGASEPWLIFMDDDCEMVSCAIVDILTWLSNQSPLVGAAFCITEFGGLEDYWFRVLKGSDFLQAFSEAGRRRTLAWGPTSLALFRREALVRVNGFDCRIETPAGGEDVDVCLRLRADGWRLIGIPRVFVIHNTATWCGAIKTARRSWFYGVAEYELQRLWPDLRLFDACSFPVLFVISLFVAGLLSVLKIDVRAALLMPMCYLAGTIIVDNHWRKKRIDRGVVLYLLLLIYRAGYLFRAAAGFDARGLICRLNWTRINSLGSSQDVVIGKKIFLKWIIAIGLFSTAVMLGSL